MILEGNKRELMYKSKLQELCHGKKWGLPRYTAMKDGPDHNPCFKASVSLHGFSFDSPACKSSKQAQNQAALLAFVHFTSPPFSSYSSGSSTLSTIEPNSGGPKMEGSYKSLIQSDDAGATDVDQLKEEKYGAAGAVSMSLSRDGSQINDESGHYKNLLQELAQKEGFSMPTYKIVISGASHMPTFSSTVELEGEKFWGEAEKSKKEAELNAAKVAYIALKQRRLRQATELTSPHLIETAPKTTQRSDLRLMVDSVKNVVHEHQLISSPAIKYEECAKEIKELQMDNMNEAVKSSLSSESIRPLTEEKPSPQAFVQPNVPDVSITDANVGNGAGPRSYLLCNKVRVYTRFPDIEFPDHITVLPVSDDKWVAFSLDFPNEESN